MIRIIFYLILLVVSVRANAHEGHGDAEASKDIPSMRDYFSSYAVSDKFEMVLRYQPIQLNEQTVMRLFISDFASNKPINHAKLEISNLEGDLKFTSKRLDSGIYEITGMFPAHKIYDLVVNISAGDKADLLTLSGIDTAKTIEHPEEPTDAGNNWKTILFIVLAFILGIFITWLLLGKRGRNRTLSILMFLLSLTIPLQPFQNVQAHEGHGEAAAAKNSPSSTGTSIEIPKETQFLFDVETAFSKSGSFQNLLSLNARILPTTQGEARIMAPQASSVIKINVTVGQKVGKGQVLAIIEQTLAAAEQVQLATEKKSNQGELEQAKKDYDRLKSLEGIVARKEIVAAEIRYRTALENQKVYNSVSVTSGRTVAIKSPINGVVTNFNLSSGQILEQGQQLFSVVDNSKVKIEAQIFPDDLSKITDELIFSVANPADENRLIPSRLIAFNKIIEPLTQSSTIVLEADNPNGSLMPGQFVTVNVQAASGKQQILVPGSAIVEIDGKPVVFVHTAPEKFELIFVQADEGNAESVPILKGLRGGERVVINGAYQVKSIYLNQ